jgi:hypothetical protein
MPDQQWTRPPWPASGMPAPRPHSAHIVARTAGPLPAAPATRPAPRRRFPTAPSCWCCHRDVAISFDTGSPGDGGVSIHMEGTASGEALATIPLKNCKLLPDTQAKYTSAKRRLTLRCARGPLLPRGPPAAPRCASSGRCSAPGARPGLAALWWCRCRAALPARPHAPPPPPLLPPSRLLSLEGAQASSSAQSTNSFQFLDDDDVEDSLAAGQGAGAGQDGGAGGCARAQRGRRCAGRMQSAAARGKRRARQARGPACAAAHRRSAQRPPALRACAPAHPTPTPTPPQPPNPQSPGQAPQRRRRTRRRRRSPALARPPTGSRRMCRAGTAGTAGTRWRQRRTTGSCSWTRRTLRQVGAGSCGARGGGRWAAAVR